jgi:hypothetical protein
VISGYHGRPEQMVLPLESHSLQRQEVVKNKSEFFPSGPEHVTTN